MTESAPSPPARRGALLGLIALTVLAYAPAWPGGFTIEDWSLLQHHRRWRFSQTVAFELGQPLRNRDWVERERPDFFYTGSWRPWQWILMHGEQRLFDDWTPGYFVVRVSLLCCLALLAATVAWQWTRRAAFAWLVGALFALHPSRYFPAFVMVHSQILSATLGALLALWGIGAWRAGRAHTGAAALVVGTVASCGFYEQGLAMLLAWPVLDALWPLSDGERPRLGAVATRAAVMAAPLALYLVLRVVRFEGFGGYTRVGGDQVFDLGQPVRLLWGALVAGGSALWSLAMPVYNPASDIAPDIPDAERTFRAALNVALLLATVGLGLIRTRGMGRRAVYLAAALLSFVVWTCVPVAGIQRGHNPWSRYIFVPGSAWAVFLAWTVFPRNHTLRAWRSAAVCLAASLLLAWSACGSWRTAWRQAHGLHDALVARTPRDRTTVVYLDGFREWVRGINLFIRSLRGPIDVGLDPQRVRIWPAHWSGPASAPVPAASAWPFAQLPFVRLGEWHSETATLELKPAPAYHPGRVGDALLWDMDRREDRGAWNVGPLLALEPGRGRGLRFTILSEFATLDSPTLSNLTWTPAVLGLTMRVQSPATVPDWLEILFYTPRQTIAAQTHLLRVRTRSDGAVRHYAISLLDHPAPALEGPLDRLSLRLSRYPGARVQLETVWLAAAGAGPPEG